VWLDGRIVPRDAARVSVLAHSLHYGTAVFDGCRFYATDDGRSAVFRLPEHIARFLRGMRALYMTPPFTAEELVAASRQVVAASGMASGSLRQLAFYGDGETGLAADNPVAIAIMAWPSSLAPARPLRLRIAGFGHGAGWLPGTKLSGQYARAFLARREAEQTGVDDALFLGPDGTIAEATTAAVFAVQGGVLTTPPASAPILDSITRASILVLAAEAGIPAVEAPIRRDALLGADEVFLAASALEVRAVEAVEGRPYPAPGPMTTRLQGLYHDVVRGRDPRHHGWLDLVEPTSRRSDER
jgi:branched-chain amino acid aminotransferase